MDQDIAVRLANEGVPVRAIARAVQVPSADVRERLEIARAHGDLIDLPREDWPAGYPREQRLLVLARLEANNKTALETAARSVFKIYQADVSMLLTLLANGQVAVDQLIVRCPNTTHNSARQSVHRLRDRLGPLGFVIETVYGYGYLMSAADRRKALNMILAATRSQRRTTPSAAPPVARPAHSRSRSAPCPAHAQWEARSNGRNC